MTKEEILATVEEMERALKIVNECAETLIREGFTVQATKEGGVYICRDVAKEEYGTKPTAGPVLQRK